MSEAGDTVGEPRSAAKDEDAFRIVDGDLEDPRVMALLHHHLETARAATALCSAHALDLEGLRSPDVRLWAAWDGDDLLGVGALKRLTDDHGEVKSMHTAERARRRGVGGAMLRHIIATAKGRGMTRLSLETGSSEYFHPAVALYQRHGFVPCPPFSEYFEDPNSVFLTLELGTAPGPAAPSPELPGDQQDHHRDLHRERSGR